MQQESLLSELNMRMERLESIKGDLEMLKTQSQSDPLQFYNKDMTLRYQDHFWDKYRRNAALSTYKSMLDNADKINYDARSLHAAIPVTYECDRNYFQR